ncbi:L,D-transpeptidase family protein [Chloroflexales bacterium ZM16-3]|nr:L,D-transpeptidase family protein [Chloroflexales bacterium ZM16-3]
MPPRRLITAATLLLITLIAGAATLWLRPAQASIPVGDFAAPMSAQQARAAVAEAQAIQQAQRQEVGRQLGAIDPQKLPLSPTIYFAESGHHLSNRSGFLNFWRANGQKLIFGYPITEELVEGGRIVQYFERARFEFHPETPNAPVQLGLIGSDLVAADGIAPDLLAGVENPQSGASYFPETSHSLSGEIRGYWDRHGAIGIFGFPISEPLLEDGRTVQYFERARLEWWPEDMDSFFRSQESINGFNLNTLYEVRVSDMGRRLATARSIDIAPVEQLSGTAIWSPAIWQRHIDVNLSTQQLVAYEGTLAVWHAPVATGRDGFNTPTGEFAIYYRLPMQDMTGSIGGESWYVPHIPWVQYIVGGVAFHGTYWHNAHGSGVRMSHGCVNLRIDDAEWLYAWADIGTVVDIHY